jgi:ankyrin repeat protein
MSSNKLREYCIAGDIDSAENEMVRIGPFIQRELVRTYDYALLYACEGGNGQLIKYLIPHGVNYNYVLQGACKGGNTRIVNQILKLGVTNYNQGLYGACEGGHIQIVEQMVKLGARGYNTGLRMACQEGKIQMVHLMIKYGASWFDDGLYGVYIGISRQMKKSFKIPDIMMQIIKLMLDLGADISKFYNYKRNSSEVITLLENNIDIKYLKNIEGYDKLTNNLNNFKQKTSSSLSQYLLDPLISIIISYSVL